MDMVQFSGIINLIQKINKSIHLKTQRMRLHGRKVLSLSIVFVLVILLSISYFSNTSKQSDENVISDNFLIHLPVQLDEHTFDNNILINLTDFKYLLPNDLCRRYDRELLAIFLVTSYAGNDALRSAHRQAISQSKLAEMGFQRIFMLAALPAREKFITQKQLTDEQQRFGDLLQGNFIEDYRNLSYKHIMALRWASTDCARAKFIIKLDDDIIYDVFHLRRYLESLEVQRPKLIGSNTLLGGYVLNAKPPIRNSANKWYVKKQEYAEAMYPAYLSGWLYVTNPATAASLVAESRRAAFFWIDDTWVTGILRARLGIPLERCNEWYSANAEFLDCCVRDLKQSNYECEYYVGPNGGDGKLLIEFLHNVEKCYFDECSKRPLDRSLKHTCVAGAKNILPAHGAAQVQPIKLR